MMNLSNIKYLALEGGGGKGNAFFGALSALEEFGILKGLKGVSGSSAGAITALLISCGYNTSSIIEIITKKEADIYVDPLKFFDDMPNLDTIGITGIKKQSKFDFSLNTNLEDFLSAVLLKDFLKKDLSYSMSNPVSDFFQKEIKEFSHSLKKETITDFVSYTIGKLLNFTLQKISKNAKSIPPIFESILNDTYRITNPITKIQTNKSQIKDFLKVLFLQGGIFTGAYPLDIFEKIIAKDDLFKRSTKFTFLEHFNKYGIELKITGVNLRTSQLVIFSRKTTPAFPVSLAVRISMNLPILYKPIYISEEDTNKLQLDESFVGYYLDGGLFNNSPYQYYDNSKSLLLRLGNRNQDNQVVSFVEYLSLYLTSTILGAGGSGLINATTIEEYNKHVIELDTTGLSTLGFKVDFDVLTKNIITNFNITKDFINNSA